MDSATVIGVLSEHLNSIKGSNACCDSRIMEALGFAIGMLVAGGRSSPVVYSGKAVNGEIGVEK